LGGSLSSVKDIRGFPAILGILLRILFLTGAVLLIPALVGFIYGEYREVEVFLITGLTTMALSYLLSLNFPIPPHITLSEALLLSGIGWLIVAFLGAIPYVLIANMSWVDAYFESMSGFTTTGMTMFRVIEGVPKSLLFWRALTQWLGGAGIIMLFIILAGSVGSAGLWRLYLAEARETKIRTSTWATVRDIWVIYSAYTLACIIILWILGMDLFDAVTHAFTALATGGFSSRTESIAAFNNPAIEATLTVFEFLGSVSFAAHYMLFKYGVRKFIEYYEVKGSLIFITFSTSLILLDLVVNRGYNPVLAFRYSIFQVVSIMTTTGYTTADINSWPPLSKFVLVCLMFIGGNLCSTGGAIKVGRIITAFKIVKNQLELLTLPPGTVKPVKVNGHVIDANDVSRLFMFLTLYLTSVAVGTLILVAYGYEPFAALSVIASAQGNVGPAYASLYELPELAKVLLIFHMWLGRLELTPVMALLNPATWVNVYKKVSY